MAQTLTFKQEFAVPLSHEQRSYLSLKLPNGVHGIVITDPSEDLVSCSLSVAAGHHSNPDNIPGLAHLCEHMICLSSTDFPTPDTYGRAIHNAGGNKNAMTTNEFTSYYFSLPITSSQKTQSDFEHVLEVFTSNFDCPLFDQGYSNREIYAVDNEHTVNKSKKNRLAFQGYKLLSNKDHQFSRFSTGSFSSLTESCKKYDIRSKLVDFFNTEYTPEKMSFVLRGPQSLNYLQKVAIMNFGKIGNSKAFKAAVSNPKTSLTLFKPKLSTETFNPKIVEQNWAGKYKVRPFNDEQLQKAVIINKDVDSVLRISFPISFKNLDSIKHRELVFYQDYWCELFGSESVNTIASTLMEHEFIITITTKTCEVTFDTTLLELELTLTTKGKQNIKTILDIVFNYAALFDVEKGSKFVKHLAKSMSQFNGIQMYNFLYAETGSQSLWEVKSLSNFLLHDTSIHDQFFLKQISVMDSNAPGYQGSYMENKVGKEWWINQADQFCKFMKKHVAIKNLLISYVGNVNETNLDWIKAIPESYKTDKNFDFEYKICNINDNLLNESNLSKYKLNLSPPNAFAESIADNQTQLLQSIEKTKLFSNNAALGYSVKNVASSNTPQLVYSDNGSQLWIKQEIDMMYKNKILFTMELINTEIEPCPFNVAALEVLAQLVNFRVNEYLYPATTLNYAYDLYPSFKGDTGILLHVSGPRHNFSKVLTILILEIKLIIESFKTSITKPEFEKAKSAVMFRFENVANISSMETAGLGMMALIEEDTWMSNLRIKALKDCTFTTIQDVLPNLFSQCYLTSFLHGDVDNKLYNEELMPIVKKLATNLNSNNHQFPSSIKLPSGSNYYARASTKDATNSIQYFIHTCTRKDVKIKSITKFVSFLMSMSLITKLRTEYQLGYIALAGLKSFRNVQGLHISLVTGSYTASELESKIDDILVEWYDQNFKKMKQNQLNDLIEKFIASETASNKSGSTSGQNRSIFYGAIGSSAGDKKSVKQHSGFWEQLDNKSYAFSSNILGEDYVDYEIVKKIDVSTLTNFIKDKILPTSKERSKISVLIDSLCSTEEMEKEFKGVQLYLFLSSMGLPIKQEHLQDILKVSGNSQIALGKNLYKYYREKGKSLTLLAAMMAKLSKSMLFSNETSKVEVALTPIEVDTDHIAEWQKQIGYVRETQTMGEKLKPFQKNL